jgi:hypothetical protein
MSAPPALTAVVAVLYWESSDAAAFYPVRERHVLVDLGDDPRFTHFMTDWDGKLCAEPEPGGRPLAPVRLHVDAGRSYEIALSVRDPGAFGAPARTISRKLESREVDGEREYFFRVPPRAAAP